jgi:hypothetical protein
MNAINAGIRTMAQTISGVFLADFFAAWDSGDGTPITNYTYDGLHPTALGASILGPVYAAARDQAVAGLYVAPSRVFHPTNLAPNPTFTGDTAGVADNTTVAGFTPTKVSGNQQLALGASATGTAAQTATVVAGDYIVGEVTLDADAFTAVTAFNLKLVAGANTAYDLSPLVLADSVTYPIPSPGSTVTLRTFPIAVPTGTTTATLTVTMTTGAGGSGTVRLKTAAVRSLVPA